MRELDEDDVRIRPRRGNSRPRSKHRPTHAAGAPGRVIAVDRGRFTAMLDDGGRPIHAVKARELGRKAVVVGDAVWLTGDLAGGPDALARIVRIEPRTTVLRRSADDDDPDERILVANAEQLAIVASLADPEPSPGLIDRCLVAAYDEGLAPLLVLTKADLADPAPLLALYAGLQVPTLICGRAADGGLDPAGVARLRRALAGMMTCFVGHSGVGKSTLVNALVPAAERLTGEVNAVTGRGRHTSSQAVAIPLGDAGPGDGGPGDGGPGDGGPGDGGWLIDTPGVRSFGLAHVQPGDVLRAFPEFADAAEQCPRGCPHSEGSLECALDAVGATSAGAAERLASLRRLMAVRPQQPGA